MGDPARAMSKQDAFTELLDLQSSGVILLEGAASEQQVSLDGWDGEQPQDGNVAGVVIRYSDTGRRLGQADDPDDPPRVQASSPAAPDRLDPRNALALIRLCQWLKDSYGVTELYHLGISGGGVNKDGTPRVDCHGQGRAVDFVGVKAVADDGSEWFLTVSDDWGDVSTAATPGGNWPDDTGANVSYRLDDEDADPFTRDFFRSLYEFIASEWQDRSQDADGPDIPTAIGESSFIMNPDHPATAPGKANGREAHKSHLHMQIGHTGTEH